MRTHHRGAVPPPRLSRLLLPVFYSLVYPITRAHTRFSSRCGPPVHVGHLCRSPHTLLPPSFDRLALWRACDWSVRGTFFAVLSQQQQQQAVSSRCVRVAVPPTGVVSRSASVVSVVVAVRLARADGGPRNSAGWLAQQPSAPHPQPAAAAAAAMGTMTQHPADR
jgi:hypothetical protein